ncbi:OB-fold domain-containing protein [Paraburkholderia sp. LEh10]|uniref:3-hydroxyacyl-CoA dehydrogenase NAD-binding domain-containing protein n=1 Tax=Paraburkholderia sp. LEh10 TaxID=2821353 RepID=UPI001AE54995|nr:3-hydroxyacyl-CoA dehydrogenase NAD-binding domain-containing protein [Paraburkholderia sp. LEh10]MBP0594892.1 OB-fold domain-containing protein [Paraburkholderia sp. LEh10]
MKPNRGFPPAPVVFPGDEPFWEAARSGVLQAKHCSACDTLHYYPRMHCPFCGSRELSWRRLSGRGTIYSYSIVDRSPRPTAPAIIETEEGLRLNSVILDADVNSLNIGDPVTLHFVPTHDGQHVPAFTTPRAEAARAYSQAARAELKAQALRSERVFRRAVVIGAGNMGVGIAMAVLAGGLSVHLIDQSEASLAVAMERVRDSYGRDVERERLASHERDARLARLTCGQDMAEIASADVVIEAVWEDLALKQQLFAQIDRHAAPEALLATNTSTLDINLIAAATQRPHSVVGLHFFNPANVMRLIEVVRTSSTSIETLDAARNLASSIGKVAIVVGVCDGFAGNRMMIARERQAARLLLEGALPDQIDRVLRKLGLPMGTFELQDMAGGIELTFRARQRAGQKDWLIEQLHARGRTGQRAGRGYYRYEPGKRRPLVDPEVTALIEEASRVEGMERRALSDEEVHDRLILLMINEGAKLLAEGIVERASDIDLIWQLGYGWPDWKGGPMYYADMLELQSVVTKLAALRARHGDLFRPAELLVQLAEASERISNVRTSR